MLKPMELTRREAGSLLRLPDGRVLSFLESGDRHGYPVIYLHGTPGSRLERLPETDADAAAGVRSIAIERPGFGHSDFRPDRTLFDTAHDVEIVADALGLDEVTVVGLSGGGPHALACGVYMPQRVRRLVLISGVEPYDSWDATAGLMTGARLLIGASRRAPVVFRVADGVAAVRMRRDRRHVLRRLAGHVSASDRALLQRDDVREIVATTFREAVRFGSAGWAYEDVLLTRPWPFSPSDVSCHVELWHGDQDRLAPIHRARALAEALPDAELHVCPGAGHLLVFDHGDDVRASALPGEAAAAG